jgi:hypothetical protein
MCMTDIWRHLPVLVRGVLRLPRQHNNPNCFSCAFHIGYHDVFSYCLLEETKEREWGSIDQVLYRPIDPVYSSGFQWH